MILIVGASGRLGGIVARRLLAQGKDVRAMSRTPDALDELKRLGANVVGGDLRDSASLKKAMEGVTQVVASAQAFTGTGTNNPRTVDGAGNRALIDSAKAAGVSHFVFLSAYGARSNHPVEFFRIKYGVEQYLRNGGMSYTILRPTAFMEFWATLVGQPIVEKGATTIFGSGKNPINFVSVEDVAAFTLMALEQPAARNRTIETGGPENLSLLQVANIFEQVTGRSAKKSHVPLPMMRVMTLLMRPINPTLSRQIAAGIDMDTADWTMDMRATLKDFPLQLTPLETVVRRTYAGA